MPHSYIRITSIVFRLPLQAFVAPRPIMPRCFSNALLVEGGCKFHPLHTSDSIPGLEKVWLECNAPFSPKMATPASFHGRSFRTRRDLCRSSSILSSGWATSEESAYGDSWVALQREMGSLKADNRLAPRSGSMDVGISHDGVGPYKIGAQDSAILPLTKLSDQSSSNLVGRTPSALTGGESLTLDKPTSAWRGNHVADVKHDLSGRRLRQVLLEKTLSNS